MSDDQSFSIGPLEVRDYVSFEYPYLFVDYLEKVVPGKEAVGIKLFSWNEWFFPAHFPDNPMVPGNLIAEAMGQVLGFTVQSLPGNKKKKAFLISTDKFRLFNMVRPGDTLRTVATVVSYRRGMLVGHCESSVNGKRIANADISLLVEGVEVLKPTSR